MSSFDDNHFHRVHAQLQQARDRYLASVGRLALSCARVENDTYRVVLKLAGLSAEQGRAEMPRSSAFQVRKRLIGLIEGNEPAAIPIGARQRAELDLLTKQSGEIAIFRNFVLHYGDLDFIGTSEGGELFDAYNYVDDRLRRGEDAGKTLRVDRNLVEAACADLQEIALRFGKHIDLPPGYADVDAAIAGAAPMGDWKFKMPEDARMIGEDTSPWSL